MKVLSLTEPYATLIKEDKKKVETRSWKTSYRGELYIHASSTHIPKEWKNNKELMDLVKDSSLNFGNIICKCNLVECIYMTKEYIENMKKNNYQEYICGEYKEGRYAWILENIQVLDNPIKAKGHLSIWNYEEEMKENMKIELDHVYFSVSDMDKAVKFYETFLGIKVTHREGNRWADFEIEGQEGMYFGLINKKVLGEKRIIGNNATLGIYTDDIKTAFERAKKIGATILYEPTYVQDSPYKYICFGMLDLDGNMLEIANYER